VTASGRLSPRDQGNHGAARRTGPSSTAADITAATARAFVVVVVVVVFE
jgi:hypothetical protein